MQLLVDGKEVDTLAGHVDLRRPLAKNLQLATELGSRANLEVRRSDAGLRPARLGDSMRSDDRLANQLRDTTITPNYIPHAEGSVLIEAGRTKVICTASVEDRVPPFLRNTGKGWVTAEYGMLPRATNTRMQREATPARSAGARRRFSG